MCSYGVAMSDKDYLEAYRMSDKDLASGKWAGISCFLAESAKLLESAVETGAEVISVLTTPVLSFPSFVPRTARKLVVSPEEYERLCGYPQTRNVVGICKRPQACDVSDILRAAKRVVVIEDSSNGANIAAIFRSAYAFGIDAVLVTHSCADPLFRRAARMSKGDVLRVPWARIGSQRDWAGEWVPVFHEHGFSLVALALDESAISLDELSREGKIALVLGTEGKGLMQSTLDLCDTTAIIPMREGIDSLNVAAAGAVACWEITRQR